MSEPGTELLVSLYERHSRELTRYVRRYVDDPATAEDVVQETMLRVWRASGRLDPDTNPRGYLFTVARNVLTDEWRRRGAGRVVDQPVAEPPAVSAVSDDVEAALDGMVVAQALDRLSADHRQVVQLVYLRQLPVNRVAAMLGLPPGTVKSRCYYAVRHLRSIFEEMGVV
jgi:RNA polymerase sigma-70 factor (ECF subfamily)